MPPERERPPRRTPSPNLRSPASCLPEEAIDIICAHVRDDDDFELSTRTLCSLALTNRRFLSSAVRALWYDPTRAIAASESYAQMQRCLEKLFMAPHLGRYVRALHHLPDLLDIVLNAALSSIDLSVWMLAISRFSCRVTAVTVVPWSWSSGCMHLANLPTIRDLRLDLSTSQWIDGIAYASLECQTFLKEAHPGSLRVLALPPMELEASPGMDPVIIDVEHLFLTSCLLAEPDLTLRQLFDFRGLRFLTYQVDDYYDGVQLGVLDGSTSELTELSIEPHPRLLRAREEHAQPTLDIWIDELPVLDRLVRLRLRRVFLRTAEVQALPTRCPALETFSLTACTWVETSLEAWLRLAETLPHLQDVSFDDCESVQIRDPLKEVCTARGIGFRWSLASTSGEITDDDSSGDDAAASSQSSSPWAEGDFPAGEADAAWYWVFNEIGRPFAIPHDPLTFSSCPTCSEREAALDSAMSDVTCEWQFDEVEYLPAEPDEPRFEPGYQAVDPDNEDESCSVYEPWLTWSEPCDLAAADAAWIAYDIDEEGRESARRRLGDLGGDQELQEAIQDFNSGRSGTAKQ